MGINAIQLDTDYYWGTMSDGAYNKFADAVQDVGPSPCKKFDCPRQSLCATEGVECKAFRFWVNNGSLETYSLKEDKKISIEKDIQRILRNCE